MSSRIDKVRSVVPHVSVYSADRNSLLSIANRISALCFLSAAVLFIFWNFQGYCYAALCATFSFPFFYFGV